VTCYLCGAISSDFHESLWTHQWNEVCRACEVATDVETMRLKYEWDEIGIEVARW
jgi:hypothetical protein